MYTQHRARDKKLVVVLIVILKIQRGNLQVTMEDVVWPALLQPTLVLFEGSSYTLFIPLFRHHQQNIFVKTQLPPVDGL